MALKGLKVSRVHWGVSLIFQVLEMAGLAPAPVCGMILADHGADVLRIDKVNCTCRVWQFMISLSWSWNDKRKPRRLEVGSTMTLQPEGSVHLPSTWSSRMVWKLCASFVGKLTFSSSLLDLVWWRGLDLVITSRLWLWFTVCSCRAWPRDRR